MNTFIYRIQKHRWIISILIISFIATFYGINSWKFSYIGDEWPFFIQAQNLLNQNFSFSSLFKLNGVYGFNPLLGSWYQALFLKLFGPTNLAWRLSNVLLIIPTVILFYAWAKKVFNEKVAIYSAALFGTSATVTTYFKIGYPNPVALCLFVAILYMTQRIISDLDASKFTYLILGLLWGISFSFYIGPLFPIISITYILASSRKSITLKHVFYLLFGYVILVLPTLFISGNSLLEFIAAKSFTREFSSIQQVITNITQLGFSFFADYDYFNNHFIAGSLLQPITQVLLVYGLLISINTRWKENRHIICTLLATVVIIGFTIPYSYIPVTRSVFLVPLGYIFVGFAIDSLIPKRTFIAIGLVMIIGGLNIYQAHIKIFDQTGHSPEAFIVRELQTDNNQVTYISNSPPFYTQSLQDTVLKAYQIDPQRLQFTTPIDFSCRQVQDTTTMFLTNEIGYTFQQEVTSCPNDKIIPISPEELLITKFNPSIRE